MSAPLLFLISGHFNIMKLYKEEIKRVYLVQIECTKEGFISSSTHVQFMKKHPEYNGCKKEYFIEEGKYFCLLYREEALDFVEM